MIFKNGEIKITPKTLFWIETPVPIYDEEKIEFLKNDILILESSLNLEKASPFKKNDKLDSFFLFNLDGIIHKNNIKDKDILHASTKISDLINQNIYKESIVHTNMINNQLAHFFKNQKIHYLEKNLSDHKSAIHVAQDIIKYFFHNTGVHHRTSIRLNFYPDNEINAKIIFSNEDAPYLGYLKDLSLDGLGIYMPFEETINLRLGELIKIELYSHKPFLTIKKGLITRIDKKTKEVGISFNLNDKKMINEDQADYITSMIYNWLKEYLKTYKEINVELNEQLNFFESIE
ncbi:MAG: PilZ domain-containing protein [Spirochaetes bacterium]|nr:PilZ domain-containing protein [Spirochaetota bacterium]